MNHYRFNKNSEFNIIETFKQRNYTKLHEYFIPLKYSSIVHFSYMIYLSESSQIDILNNQ